MFATASVATHCCWTPRAWGRFMNYSNYVHPMEMTRGNDWKWLHSKDMIQIMKNI